MKTVASFDGLKFRTVDESDRDQIERWLDADPHHRLSMHPEFFLGQDEQSNPDPRPTCYALEDENGTVFYVRISRAARVYIQFSDEGNRAQKVRNGRSLEKGMALLETLLAKAGVEQWIFNTTSPRLREMATTRLGFTDSTHELVREIPALKLDKGQEEALQPPQPGAGEGR